MTRAACWAGAANLAIVGEPAAHGGGDDVDFLGPQPAVQLGGRDPGLVQLQQFPPVAIQLGGQVAFFANRLGVCPQRGGFGLGVEGGRGLLQRISGFAGRRWVHRKDLRGETSN